MGFDLAKFHDRHRDKIIREWVRLLHTEISETYSLRPLDELTETVTEAGYTRTGITRRKW